MSSDHSKRLAAQDLRNEVRRMERHEAEVRRTVEERWQRRIQPLLASVDQVEDPQYPGCFW